MPEDPRDIVRFTLGDRTYRLAGGNVERPIANLERLLTLAAAADEVLIPTIGFGMQDLAEVVLTHVDAELERASFVESERSFHPGDSDVALSAGEILEEEREPQWHGRHKRALSWITVAASALRYRPASGESTFGSAMRVVLTGEDTPRWMPLELLPEALASAASELAEAAAIKDSHVRKRFAQLSAARARRRLWRFSPVIIGPPDHEGRPVVAQKNTAQWAVPSGNRDLLALQIVSPFFDDGIGDGPPAVLDAALADRADEDGLSLPLVGGEVLVEPGQQVIPILVAAGTNHLIYMGPPGCFNTTMEDLDWMALSAGSESDLRHFAEEMRLQDPSRIFGLETINVWDWWLNNGGALHRGGQFPAVMYFEAHRGAVEWERARRLSGYEEALLKLDLPPIRDWDIIEDQENAPVVLAAWRQVESSGDTAGYHHRPPITLATIHKSDIPVAIVLPARNMATDELAEPGFDLAGAFAFSLDAIDAAWISTARTAGITALRVNMQLSEPASEGEESDPFAIEVTACEKGRASVQMTVGFDELARLGDKDAQRTQELLCSSFVTILEKLGAPEEARVNLRTAWLSSPPTLTVKQYNGFFARNQMAEPVEVEGPLAAQMDRQLAERVRETGVLPGTYSPEQAKELDRVTLAPAALQTLEARIADFPADDLLMAGMQELERILTRRARHARDLQQSSEDLTLTSDPIERQRAMEADALRLRRAAELVVEATLLIDPQGQRHIDARGWAEVLAAAASYLEATTRSEGLHYQVASTGLEVSELFELKLAPASPRGPQNTLDYAAFARAVAEENLTQSWPEASDTPDREALMDEADALALVRYGTKISDIAIVLFTLATWPLTSGDPDAVAVSEDSLIAFVLESIGEGTTGLNRNRIAATVRFLRSTQREYISSDWVPWRLRSRPVRLLTKPLVALSDSRILVAPHYCEAVARVYMGYWNYGMLPWTQTGSPQLDAALERVRNHRNLELETQVEQMLNEHGWITRSRVKPGKGNRIGVSILTSEIDIVAAHPSSASIWVLEVKDPGPAYAPSDIRRHIGRFHDGPKSYSALLSRKLSEVSAEPLRVAEALGLPASKSYSIKATFVTRREAPAAYAGGNHRFATVAKLLDLLEDPSKHQ
ncbi:hypothetical protein [Leifsonia sp. 2MCAF36]|uniref:hypothetical protein n=1 Tax=Leifsonia sp. 2MCAF36 TaxID=3232988 RepID=UPI003F9B077A